MEQKGHHQLALLDIPGTLPLPTQVLYMLFHCPWIIQHENGKSFTNVEEVIRCGRRLVRCLPRNGRRKSANQGRAEETEEKRAGTWKEEKSRKEEKERRNEKGYLLNKQLFS
jgi:hypothetical protein